MIECPDCYRVFNSERGMKTHRGKSHSGYKSEERLRELYIEKRLSTYEISEKINIAPTNVAKLLREYGIPRRNKSEAQGGYKFTKEELEELYYGKGLSTVDIAKEYDMDSSCVSRQMERRGVERDYSGKRNYNWTGGKQKAECVWCGEIVMRTQSEIESSKNILCSKECQYEWISEYNSGKDSPLYKERVEIACEYCGDSKKVRPFKSEQRFCSRECNNAYLSEEVTGENHPLYKGEHGDYSGPNWDKKRRERLNTDDWECVSCGMDNEAHISLHDCGLHVHHIQPRSEFRNGNGEIDWRKANDISNLITLCASCHQRWEGIPLRPQKLH